MDEPLGPPAKMDERAEELTPMMAQYYDLCCGYDDALVLFQVGDFYEAFCEAAETVARRCEITLTQREDSTGEYAMAGVPVDNAESYIERLLDAGYRVAIADQVQDPEETTGVVDRAVTRIITPGTLTEDELLDTDRNNYVAALAGADTIGLAVLDVSTGEFYATSATAEETIVDELGRFDPAEAILGPDAPTAVLPDGCVVSPYHDGAFDDEKATDVLESYFGPPERLLATENERRACGALVAYAEYVRAGENDHLPYLNHLTRYNPREYMLLDAVAIESLELFERRAVQGREGATLAAVVDETASALGRRTLDDWLRRPLIDSAAIRSRHDAVGELRESVVLREAVHDELRDVYDIERLISRIARGRANARDLRSLKETLDVVARLAELLSAGECDRLVALRENLDPLDEIRTLVDEAIQEDPAREITEGGLIKPSYDDELADLRATERDGKSWIDDLEQREREKTGIDSLKVGHNSVHGYYVEVTDANLDSVPDRYERRQTLKNAERYYTPALKDREDEILSAESRADELEYELFRSVRSVVGDASEAVQKLADALAALDVLVSFATVAAKYDYTRPAVVDPDEDPAGLHIQDGRHPVVERTEDSFVPNDTHLDDSRHLAVITGPNMSGKSTYMRQVALSVVLAQAGSFVPASEARLQVVDRIFTRVGASDDIAGGRSTFMVEMSELATILDQASNQSLVLLDEVGRGTSTADGQAIAQAVTEYLHDEVRPFTLFATHHHDLTEVADRLGGACNRFFKTSQTADGVVFEHEIAPGSADASYGVAVAATAGVEETVVDRARAVLDDEPALRDRKTAPENGTGTANSRGGEAVQERSLEHFDRTTSGGPRAPRSQDGSTTADEASVRRRLLDVDIATMTPLEALETLAELKTQVDDES